MYYNYIWFKYKMIKVKDKFCIELKIQPHKSVGLHSVVLAHITEKWPRRSHSLVFVISLQNCPSVYKRTSSIDSDDVFFKASVRKCKHYLMQSVKSSSFLKGIHSHEYKYLFNKTTFLITTSLFSF